MYKFIFVDDEDLIRELFSEIMDFESYGFHLEKSLPSAELALSYLRENKDIDLVITDVKMGHMSGIDLCREIREAGLTTEIVVLSGYEDFEYAKQAIRHQVFDYLLKPTTYGDLESLFKRLKAALDEKNPDKQYRYNQLIDSAKSYINENFANHSISLEDVARFVSMNPAYLSRYFKQQTGTNFIDYLSGVRVNKAKELLMDNTVKVYEICTMVGYKNTQHFYKIFKQYTGYTPTEFRSRDSG